jgi:hypothetical protein
MLKTAGANTTRLTMSERVKTIIEMVRPIIQGMDKEEKAELKQRLGIGSQQQTNHIEGVGINNGDFHFNPRQDRLKPKVEIVVERIPVFLRIYGRCDNPFYLEEFKNGFSDLCFDLGLGCTNFSGCFCSEEKEDWLVSTLPLWRLDPLIDKIEHHFPSTDWDLDFSIVGE